MLVKMAKIVVLATLAAAGTVTHAHSASGGRHRLTVRSYARHLTIRRWSSRGEWRALNEIVIPESGWDPCEHFPSTHECGYAGSNACGVAQRDPCPWRFRGRLWASRWAQVRDLIAYVAGRYGDPYRALAYRQAHGTY